MKKRMALGLVLLSLIFIIGYFVLPGKIVVAQGITATGNQAALSRFLDVENNWKKWWPSDTEGRSADPGFLLSAGDFNFTKAGSVFNALEITIVAPDTTYKSFLYVLPVNPDSVNISWTTTLVASRSLFGKIHLYFRAKEISNKLAGILEAMKKYIADDKNIYGIKVRREKMALEYMASARQVTDHEPTNKDIYALIGQVKNYISKIGATAYDYPLVNISTLDTLRWNLMVAVPVDKPVPTAGIFSEKRMLKNGNVLVTEVTGGKSTIDAAWKQIAVYAGDHQYLNMAIPYQQLVTDRMQVTDSTKWVTRISFPIL
jgi:hypothetical protein